MRKIINGKMYNTDTAIECGEWTNGLGWNDFSHVSETLYRKKTGEFFLHGDGGPRTKYSRRISTNMWEGGENIIPLTEDEARKWAEEKLEVDEYIAVFGYLSE